MKKPLLFVTVIALIWVWPVMANTSIEQRLAEMEQRLVAQEIRDRMDMLNAAPFSGGEWLNRVQIGGAVGVDPGRVFPGNNSNLITATTENSINAQVKISTEITAMYEKDENDADVLIIDTALVKVANPDSDWFMHAGQYILPFGTYQTHLFTGPLTTDLGKTSDSAIEVGFVDDSFTASAYIFRGDHKNGIGNFGVALNAHTEIDKVSVKGHLGYISNLAESDRIVDDGWVTATGDEVAGWMASVALGAGNFTLVGEYLAAVDGFTDADGDKPIVYNIEASYKFEANNRPATIAVAYHGTEDAENANWELDEKRILLGFSVELMKGTNLGLEYGQTENYAGGKTDIFTSKLALEF